MVRVLLVEDNQIDAFIFESTLARSGEFEITVESRGEDALALLTKENFDIIVLDHYLPGMGGLTILKDLKRRGIQTPVVYLTGVGSEDVAVEALKLGAFEYLNKDKIQEDTLINVLQRTLKESGKSLTKDAERYYETGENKLRELSVFFDAGKTGEAVLSKSLRQEWIDLMENSSKSVLTMAEKDKQLKEFYDKLPKNNDFLSDLLKSSIEYLRSENVTSSSVNPLHLILNIYQSLLHIFIIHHNQSR